MYDSPQFSQTSAGTSLITKVVSPLVRVVVVVPGRSLPDRQSGHVFGLSLIVSGRSEVISPEIRVWPVGRNDVRGAFVVGCNHVKWFVFYPSEEQFASVWLIVGIFPDSFALTEHVVNVRAADSPFENPLEGMVCVADVLHGQSGFQVERA